MGNLLNRENERCQRLRDALEALPLTGNARTTLAGWMAELPAAESEHAGSCEKCKGALEELMETRQALSVISSPAPGPWFAARVMAAINAREREDEVQDGVWIDVRRFAPRLVALAALLLIVGGGWAVQQHRNFVSNLNRRAGDMVFDTSTQSWWNDDALGTVNEVRP